MTIPSLPRSRRFRVAVLWQLLALAICRSCFACDNPVYRYALENWAPADYELVLVQVGDLTTDEAKCWSELQRQVAEGPARPNLRLRSMLREQLEEPLASERDAITSTSLILVAPNGDGHPRIIWQDACTSEKSEHVFDSPARREVVQRLLANEAIVWVSLEAGAAWVDATPPTAPNHLAVFLESYLSAITAQDALEASQPAVPAATRADGRVLDKSIYWPPRFSTLVVNIEDPREAVFVAMLLATLPDDSSATDGLLFPIFGRGRALPGVNTADSPDGLRSTCDFLTGACSCQVKEMNPGKDLLLTADWSTVVAAAPSSQGLFSLLALEPLVSAEVAPSTTDIPSNAFSAVPSDAALIRRSTVDGNESTDVAVAVPSTFNELPTHDAAGADDLAMAHTASPSDSADHDEAVMSRPLIFVALGLFATFLAILIPVGYFGSGTAR